MTYRHRIAAGLLCLSSAQLAAAVPTPTPNEDGTYALEEPAVYLTWLKLQTDYDFEANKTELTKAFHWNRYTKNRNNEFSLQTVLDASLADVENKVEQWPEAPTFRIRTSASFGEYDFDKEQFAFDPIEAGAYYPIPLGRELYNPNSWTSSPGYALTIADAVKIDGVAVPRDGAQAMIESRTSRSGRVDRSVVIVYTIKVVSAGTTKVNYNNTVKELKGRVTSAKAYAVGDRQPVSEDALLASWPADS
ncbi:hypothetical protein C84B14_09107 [Salinisphaera sp. C84B14]|uniref:DUF4852 domain-containing protein n=1 Tax=Salinisphaera sp. C84B14 TaxID=1304155 RepID=UPI0033426998